MSPPARERSLMRSLLLQTVYALATAAACFAVGWAERLLAADVHGANAVWWPVGIAVLAAWRKPGAAAVGIVLGDVLFTTLDGLPPAPQAVSAVGNGLEVGLVTWTLRRLRFDPRLVRVRDVLALAATAVLGGAVFVSAHAAAAAAGLFDRRWLEAEGPVLFASDTLGVFLAGAIGFPWLAGGGRRAARRRRPSAERLVVFALLAAASYLAFAGSFGVPGWRTVLVPASYPLLVWAAVRWSPRAVAGAVAIHVLVVLAVALHGDSPFRDLGLPRGSYPHLHVYFLVAVGTVLLLAAARAQGDRASAALRDAQRLESLGQLAGGVAHEFNNLMTVILGNAQLLRFGPPPSADPDELLKQIETAAERAGVLTRQLLAFTGRQPVSRQPADVRPVVRAALGRVHPDLRLLDADPLPDAVADVALLGMAAENVARNALEAVHGAPDRVRVSVAVVPLTATDLDDPRAGPDARPGKYLRVRVADDGDGASSAVLFKMFDPFFSTKAGRRGLGLAAALGAMKACGGLIRVASVLTVGTTVDLFVPTRDTAPPTTTPSPDSR